MTEKTSRAIGRRSALRGLGLGATALGLGLGLRGSSARGQADRPPKRVIFFYGLSGSRPGLWEPRPINGAPRATETEWALNDLHMPLAAHRDRLVYFENLHMVSALADPLQALNAHVAGGTHAMTATYRRSATGAGGESIDQYIARNLEAQGAVTRLASAEIQCADWPHAEGNPVYAGPDRPLPWLWNPREVYQHLFPDGRPMPGMQDARPEQRSRVIDFVQQRFGRLDDPRLPRGARTKLEQHAEQLRSIQRRLSLGAGRDFNIPERSIVANVRSPLPGDVTAETKAQYWELTTDLNSQLAVAALHADVTRVITFSVIDAPGPLCPYDGRYYRDGDFRTPNLHELTHLVNRPSHALSRDANAREVIRQQHLRTSEVFARLLDRLADALEPDGTRLIDHTLVVWVSQIADGSHAVENLPWVIAGDCQGYFRTGRFLRSTQRRAHNDLFVSVANAMGIATDNFGNEAACNGPIPGLAAAG